MFNFSHSEAEIRDIIQALEARIFSLQKHLQSLLAEANSQAIAMTKPKVEEAQKDDSTAS